MLEGLLLEVMCKEELKWTITYDFIYVSVVLGFFWPTLYIRNLDPKIPFFDVLLMLEEGNNISKEMYFTSQQTPINT